MYADRYYELWGRMGGLPGPLEAAGIWRGIWFEEAHHSTAIEGNTLVAKEVELLLREGRAVGDKELKEYLEVKGYADAAGWVYGEALDPGSRMAEQLLSLTEVRRVHAMAVTSVWDVAPHPQGSEREAPGGFREHDIHPFPAGMRPPSWVEVPAHLVAWLASANAVVGGTTEFPETMAELHCQFEQIHPFLDGNGRTGRLVLNLTLVRLGYPPAIIYKNQRTAYLTALRQADRGEAGALGEFVARAVLDNLYKFVMPAVAGPLRLVPIAALAGAGTIKEGALRAAAVRGRLQATKGPDGQWRSTKRWVEEYLRDRYRR